MYSNIRTKLSSRITIKHCTTLEGMTLYTTRILVLRYACKNWNVTVEMLSLSVVITDAREPCDV